MMGSDGDGVVEIATSCGGEWPSQAPASVESMSSMTVKSAASALSEIWTRTVARLGSWVKLTWRSACQDSVAIWTEAPAISMQGRGPVENSPRANTAATANGTTEARRLKRNMTQYSPDTAPGHGAYGWQSVNKTRYCRVYGGVGGARGTQVPAAQSPGRRYMLALLPDAGDRFSRRGR